MGVLVEGKWSEHGASVSKSGGRFVRADTQFRNWITPDGAPGPTGRGGFKAEPRRYHLYISHACPWAHRTLIFRHLKGLTQAVGLSVVHWHMAENGQSVGPMSAPQLAEAVASGRLRPDTLVWTAGMAAWTAAGSLPQLAGLFQAGPPPLP